MNSTRFCKKYLLCWFYCLVIANILFLASKFETKLKNFGKEIFCEKRKFTGHRRNFRIVVVEALNIFQVCSVGWHILTFASADRSTRSRYILNVFWFYKYIFLQSIARIACILYILSEHIQKCAGKIFSAHSKLCNLCATLDTTTISTYIVLNSNRKCNLPLLLFISFVYPVTGYKYGVSEPVNSALIVTLIDSNRFDYK